MASASPGAFSAALELTGTLAAVTQALRRIEYMAPGNFGGHVSLHVLAQCLPLSSTYTYDIAVSLVPTTVAVASASTPALSVFEDVAVPLVLDIGSYGATPLNVTVRVQHGLVLAANLSVSATRQFSVNVSAVSVRQLNLTYVPVSVSPQYLSDRGSVCVAVDSRECRCIRQCACHVFAAPCDPVDRRHCGCSRMAM